MRSIGIQLFTVLTLSAFILAGCESGEAPEPAEPQEDAAIQPMQAAGPDTTGAAMWAHLQDEAYQENWQLWPDKGRLYEGQEPHGMLLTTYLNDTALQALRSRAGTMPPGAVRCSWVRSSSVCTCDPLRPTLRARPISRIESIDLRRRHWP